MLHLQINMRPAKYRKDKTPVFIDKLYQILQDSQNSPIIDWTPDHNAFAILDLNTFTTRILPQYFKHSNYHSFIRQLNMYRFTKVRQSSNSENQHVYQNDLFLKGHHSQLKAIKRKEASAKVQSLVPFDENEAPGSWAEEGNEGSSSLEDRLQQMKEKQEKLNQVCCTLLSQNRLLIQQNQELASKVHTESKKKDRIMKQVFRIVRASISEFWREFCQEEDTREEDERNLKELYEVFMQFIDQHDLPQILKTLDYFLGTNHEKKPKTFKVVNQNESTLLNSYSEEEIKQFLTATRILLTPNQSL